MKTCPHCKSKNTKKKGSYFVRHTRSYRRRYYCFACGRNFSNQTGSPTFRQRRSDLNEKVFELITSGNTYRGSARLLRCSRGTIDRKVLWLAKYKKVGRLKAGLILQIDEMESIEHTKLKPVTIPLCVDENYQILDIEVGRIPAKGNLARRSFKKYGPRPDERAAALNRLFRRVKTLCPYPREIITDESPFYPRLVKEYFPFSTHKRVSSRGLTEKKRELLFSNERKKVFDPMFALNQRCAKLRQDLRRLSRRSWCTTKDLKKLRAHLDLYQIKNNTHVT